MLAHKHHTSTCIWKGRVCLHTFYFSIQMLGLNTHAHQCIYVKSLCCCTLCLCWCVGAVHGAGVWVQCTVLVCGCSVRCWCGVHGAGVWVQCTVLVRCARCWCVRAVHTVTVLVHTVGVCRHGAGVCVDCVQCTPLLCACTLLICTCTVLVRAQRGCIVLYVSSSTLVHSFQQELYNNRS